jgi:hypothetical protein
MSTITALAPVLFSAAHQVAAEPFGAIDAINTNFDNKGVAKGDKVYVPYVPAAGNAEFSPANITPAGSDVTAETTAVEITKSQKNTHKLTGEQIRSLENGGNWQEWAGQWAQSAMRALRNEAEQDACTAIKKGASRAYGSAGVTPFATSLTELNQVRKILRDNGAPMQDLQLVVDTSAELNMLNLGIVQQAYAAGSDQERRSGTLRPQLGFNIRASAGIQGHTNSAAADYALSNTTSIPIGTTGLVTKTGSAKTSVGDIFHIASDTANLYVVNGLDADESTKLITIGRPGTRAVYLNNATVTFKGAYTPNFAFERNAVVGVMRPPVMPANANIKQTLVSDKFGMTYLFCEISQYGQVSWELHLAWGFKVIQPEFVATLIG